MVNETTTAQLELEQTAAVAAQSSSATWIGSFALLLALGAGGISFWLASQSSDQINELTNEIVQLKQQTDATVQKKLQESDAKLKQAADEFSSLQVKLQSEFTAALSASASQQTQLSEEVQHLSDATQAISSRIGIESTTWIVAEAEYLLTLANHRVVLDSDVNTAIAALTAADQRLKKVGDPGLLDVRRIIADEIVALRSVEIPDIAGMAFELASLASTAEELPLIIKQRPQTLQNSFTSTDEATSKVEGVSGVIDAVWKDIRSLVVIRKNDKPIDVLLAPDQRHFLFQNLILKIETGRLALLRSEPTNLKASLDVAHRWLEAYFDKDTAAYANFISTLDRIQSAKLSPVFPDITGSVNELRKYKDNKANNNVSKAPAITSKRNIATMTTLPSTISSPAIILQKNELEQPPVAKKIEEELSPPKTAEPNLAKIKEPEAIQTDVKQEQPIQALEQIELKQAEITPAKIESVEPATIEIGTEHSAEQATDVDVGEPQLEATRDTAADTNEETIP